MLERVWRKGNPLKLLVGMQASTATMENSVEIPHATTKTQSSQIKEKRRRNQSILSLVPGFLPLWGRAVFIWHSPMLPAPPENVLNSCLREQSRHQEATRFPCLSWPAVPCSLPLPEGVLHGDGVWGGDESEGGASLTVGFTSNHRIFHHFHYSWQRARL